MKFRTASRLQKALLTASVLTAAAGLAGAGTYATWSQSQHEDQAITTGTFGIALGGTSLVDDLAVTVTNVVPGDTIARRVDVTNTGNTPWKTYAVGVTGSATGTYTLHDSTANALTTSVYSCATAWSSASVTGCASPTTVVANQVITGSNSIDLTSLGADAGSATDHLLVVTGYPSTASDYANYGGLSDTITYTFSATQRDGVAK